MQAKRKRGRPPKKMRGRPPKKMIGRPPKKPMGRPSKEIKNILPINRTVVTNLKKRLLKQPQVFVLSYVINCYVCQVVILLWGGERGVVGSFGNLWKEYNVTLIQLNTIIIIIIAYSPT